MITGADQAIWRRIQHIPFNVTIPEEQQDPPLADKQLLKLPGILVWAVRGCMGWQHNGLGVPEAVKAAKEEIRTEMDILGLLLDEYCIFNEILTVTASHYSRAPGGSGCRSGQVVAAERPR